MDSFYDAPRRPPQPIPRETFAATPVVPEISVLCPPNTTRNAFIPYNQWKDTMPNPFSVSNKENVSSNFQGAQNNNSILKKQVRFESPVLQQTPLESNQLFLNKTEQILHKNQAENENSLKSHDRGQSIPSFEEMYMANIPSRQLDLSVIDQPKRAPLNEGKNQHLQGNVSEKAQPMGKEQPKTYRDFLESQKIDNKVVLNDSVTDIFNYKRNSSPKVAQNTYKTGMEWGPKDFNNQYIPVLSPNESQPVLKDPSQDHRENNRKMRPTHSGQAFQRVTEAISQRKVPSPYENVFTQSAGQSRGSENGTPKKPWFVSQGNDSGDLQNKVLFQANRNLGNSPPEIKNDLRNMKSNFEDVQNQRYTENSRFEVDKRDNLLLPKIQVDNGPQTVPSVPESPNSYKPSSHPTDSQKKRESCTQTTNDLDNFENNALKMRCDDFSVGDLLKIIAQQSQQISQQSEQLLLLQRQVSALVCQQKEGECPRQKSIQCGQERNCYSQPPRHCCSQDHCSEQVQACVPGVMSKNMENIQDRCITSTQHEGSNGLKKKLEATPKKNNMPNFSIGLTTSFEVSFRRPHNNKNQQDFLQKNTQLPDFNQYEPAVIQEITESDYVESQENRQQDFQSNFDKDNRGTLVDESMVFEEPIRVRESCPSPEPSIKINMNDFEDSESEDDLTSPEIGPSFYRNLMVQVNKILQKAQIDTTEEMAYNFKGHNLKQNTLHKVKQATLKHLKRIGVEVQSSEDSSQSSSSSDAMDGKSYNQEDISFAVKQLLMKYLPADHLAKVASKEAPTCNNLVITPKEKIGAIKNRPDFSFATVQYMKKYNLIANSRRDFCQVAKPNQPESPKILDITKLKQQPKLL